MPSLKVHTETEIDQALTYIEIFKPEDEINCTGCGYNTCRDFAQAMLNGESRPTQCTALSKKIIDKLKKKLTILKLYLIKNIILRICICTYIML